VIEAFSSSMLAGESRYTKSFKCPQRKKSKGLRSGEYGVWSPHKIGLEADHTIVEVGCEPLQKFFRRVGRCSILHQPVGLDVPYSTLPHNSPSGAVTHSKAVATYSA